MYSIEPNIFIIEDDPVYLKMLTYKIDAAGYTEIRSFASGEEGLDALTKGMRPDLVLLDFQLGGINGLDTLRGIKKLRPKTKVIVITMVDDEKVKQECLANGASTYLIKEQSSVDDIVSYIDGIKKKKQSFRQKIMLIAGVVIISLTILLYFTPIG